MENVQARLPRSRSQNRDLGNRASQPSHAYEHIEMRTMERVASPVDWVHMKRLSMENFFLFFFS